MGSEFLADATGTGHSRGQCCPHSILGLVGEDTPPHTCLFPWKQMQEALWLLPSPSYTPLRQPVGSSSAPPLPPSCVLGGAPEPRLVRHPAPCCALPFSPLAFSLHLQRLGRYQGRQDPSPTIHITHLSPSQVGKKKVKQKQTKKSFVQRYIFIIQSLYSTKKERKKGVNFFSLL